MYLGRESQGSACGESALFYGTSALLSRTDLRARKNISAPFFSFRLVARCLRHVRAQRLPQHLPPFISPDIHLLELSPSTPTSFAVRFHFSVHLVRTSAGNSIRRYPRKAVIASSLGPSVCCTVAVRGTDPNAGASVLLFIICLL